MQQRRQIFTSGVLAVAPMLPGVAPFGMVAGLTAADTGLSVAQAMAMSLAIFAGASQLATLQLMAEGALPAVILLTALTINLRFAMYSASMAPHLQHLGYGWRLPLAYLLVDQTYALSIHRYRMSDTEWRVRGHWFYLGVGLSLWLTWQAANAVGVFMAAGVPGAWSLDFAIPLVFMVLLVPAMSSRPHVVAALILLPLGARAGALRRTWLKRGRLLGLCLAVGLGFLFVEIAFIQRFMLILGHPVYAVALVLAGFLVFAGAGSALAQRIGDGIWRPVLGITVLAGGYLVLLPVIGAPLAAQAAPVRIGACLGLIAPLALCMGMPYARALRRVGDRDPALLPWAWGVNGFASVVAAILATLLAVHFGFSAVVLIAIGLYLLAAACYRF